MASTIKKSSEIVLYRKQFDALVEAGKLIPGSTYHIVDDPNISDLLNGDIPVSSAITDSKGNVIHETYGTKLTTSIDNNTYILTLNLVNANEEIISTQTIDLPLESVVIGARYENGKLYLTTKDGNELDGIDISNIVTGLVPNTRTINGKALTSDINLSSTDLTDTTDLIRTSNIATDEKAGIARWVTGFGLKVDEYGRGQVIPASKTEIDGKTHQYKPITPSTLDYAVKSALANSRETWTDDEKARARALLEVGSNSETGDSEALINKLDRINGDGVYTQHGDGSTTLTSIGKEIPVADSLVTWTDNKTIKSADPIEDDDLVTKSYMEAKFNNTDQEVLSIKNSIETINSNIQQQTLDITGLNDRLNGLEEQIANKVTTRNTTDGLKSGQYVFLTIEE